MRKLRNMLFVLFTVLFVCVAFSYSTDIVNAEGITQFDEINEDDEDATPLDATEDEIETDVLQDAAEDEFELGTPSDANIELATSTDVTSNILDYDNTDIATDSTAKRANTTVKPVDETATEVMTKVDAQTDQQKPDSNKDDAVKTGDDSNVLLYIICLFASVLLIPMLYINKKDC